MSETLVTHFLTRGGPEKTGSIGSIGNNVQIKV